MLDRKQSTVLITQEACEYLRISRPTYVKYIVTDRIKGTKTGKGWKVLKSELDRFLGDGGMTLLKHYHRSPTRIKNCLKCGHQVILKRGFFLCEPCRKSNSHLEDLGSVYQSYIVEAFRTFRLDQHG